MSYEIESKVNKLHKISTYINELTLIISQEATCNYALISKETFQQLCNNQIKVLHYYLCLKAYSGSNSITYDFNKMSNDLWQQTIARHTLYYKKAINQLILVRSVECCKNNTINDLSITLNFRHNSVSSVIIARKRLQIIYNT